MIKPRLDALIRAINPLTFSDDAHGAGHRVVVSRGKAALYRPGLLARLRSSSDDRHLFVKKQYPPQPVQDWTFHWSEGTTAITLDFEASFVLQANDEAEAVRLAQVLAAGTEEPGEALHALISACLHDHLQAMLRDCEQESTSLLGQFVCLPTGFGESLQLNQRVGELVAAALHNRSFRIGLRVINLPPAQVEVRSTDSYTLQGSETSRSANTAAQLHLNNYQAYKRSNLKGRGEVEALIKTVIADAVRQLLFDRTYFAVVQSYAEGHQSIARQMESRIQQAAYAIGYSVKVFQTFPDIAALALIDGRRIEVGAAGIKYELLKSMGFVQIEVVVNVRTSTDFSRLHELIKPEETDVERPIAQHIRQVCRDELQRIDHQDFNLRFDTDVVPRLRLAIVGSLAQYGLLTEIISIRDMPTEERERYLAIRGSRLLHFEKTISPQANGGHADAVPVYGSLSIRGLVQDGWARFESRDWGFRGDSQRSDQALNQMAQDLALPGTGMTRRELAVELELAEIRACAVAALEREFKMIPDLAARWNTREESQNLETVARRVIGDALAREFGLDVEVVNFQRGDTETNVTALANNQSWHDEARTEAALAAKMTSEYRLKERLLAQERRFELARQRDLDERQGFDDPTHPNYKANRDRIEHEARRTEAALARADSVLDALQNPQPPPKLTDNGTPP